MCGNQSKSNETWTASMCDACFAHLPGLPSTPVSNFDVPFLNVAGMRPISGWFVLAFMTTVLMGSVATEITDIGKLAILLRQDEVRRKSNGACMRFLMEVILGTRRYAALPLAVSTVPLFIVGDKADPVSICLNVVATLIVLEVDKLLFRIILGEREQLAIHASSMHVNTAQAAMLDLSKYVHCLLAMAATLGVPIMTLTAYMMYEGVLNWNYEAIALMGCWFFMMISFVADMLCRGETCCAKLSRAMAHLPGPLTLFAFFTFLLGRPFW